MFQNVFLGAVSTKDVALKESCIFVCMCVCLCVNYLLGKQCIQIWARDTMKVNSYIKENKS